MPSLNGDPVVDDRLDEVVNEYIEEEQAGLSPDRPAILKAHPDLTAALERFFAAHDAMERRSRPLREVALAAQGPHEPDDGDGPDRALRAPREFGDYVLLDILGVGGMGVVYRALHRALKREVALKQIITGPLASDSDIQRFRNEAEAAASLHHPNIVPIHDVGEHQGQRYLTMPLLEGGSLAACLDRFRDDPRAAARLTTVVAGAVHHAHQRGVLHRDLKPSNILLDGDGQPHVTDFGLARRIGVESTLTGSGAILGSPPYMAPEQAEGRVNEITTATDVYGLGAVLYALLAGRPPFRGSSHLETLDRVRSSPPEPPRRLNPQVDRDLETICVKCLEKEPARRYPSAAAVRDDLERWLAGEPVLAQRTGSIRRAALWIRRRPWIAALLSLVFLATTLGAGGVFWQWRAAVAARKALETALYESRIALADREFSAGEPGHAMELLDDCPQSLRGWEWFHLRQHRRFDEARPDKTNTAMISVACHPNGKLLATGHGMNWITIWETDSSGIKKLLALDAHRLGVTSLSFSRDGRRMVSASFDGVAKVWDTESWQVLRALEGQPLGGLWCAAIHPDGHRIALAGLNKTVGLWDPDNGQLRTLAGHTDRVTGVAFDPFGRLLASSSDDATVKLWDVATGREVRTQRDATLFSFTCVAFSPDGRSLAAGNNGGAVTLWETASGREVFRRSRRSNLIRGLAFSPDGRRIASAGGSDRGVTIWDAGTGRDLLFLHGHEAEVWSVAFRADGEHLASAGVNMFRIWDANHGEAAPEPGLHVLRGHSDHVEALAFSSDSRHIATASWDRSVRVWDSATGRLIQTLLGPAGAATCVAFSPDGRLAASGRDRTITIWDASGKLSQRLAGHERNVACLASSHDGRLLASAGEDRIVNIWNTTSTDQSRRTRFESEGFNYSIAFSPDDSQLAVTDGSGSVILHDVASDLSNRVLRLTRNQHIRGLAYSPDGRSLAVGTELQGVQIWDPTTGQRIRVHDTHHAEVLAVAYSPNGHYLAATGMDRALRIWNASDGTELHTVTNEMGWTLGLAFSPDGRYLAATSDDRTVRVWDRMKQPWPFADDVKP